MSNTRAAMRRIQREIAKGNEPGPDRNPGIGRARRRAQGRDTQDEKLRRGLLLTLRRRERMIHDGVRFESTRSLLAQTARLEHARRVHEQLHPTVEVGS